MTMFIAPITVRITKNKLKKDEIDDVDKELKKNLMFGEKKLVSFESAFT